jgi:multisubunit Na+/H+ antiporter MnhC subunit
MSRLLVVAVIAVLLLSGLLAADQALQNPDLEPATNASDDKQQNFTETSATFLDAVPIALAAMVIGSALVAVRLVGGG